MKRTLCAKLKERGIVAAFLPVLLMFLAVGAARPARSAEPQPNATAAMLTKWTIMDATVDPHNLIPDIAAPRLQVIYAFPHLWPDGGDRSNPPTDAQLKATAEKYIAPYEIVLLDIESYLDNDQGKAVDKAVKTVQTLRAHAPNTKIGWYLGWGADPGYDWSFRAQVAAENQVWATELGPHIDFISIDIYDYYGKGIDDFRGRMEFRLRHLQFWNKPILPLVSPTSLHQKNKPLSDAHLVVSRDLCFKYANGIVIWDARLYKSDPAVAEGAWQTFLTQEPVR